MLHLRDVLGCMGKLERDAFAVPACGEAPALYDRNLVWHVGVDWIVRDRVDPRFRHDLARLVFLRHVRSLLQPILERAATRRRSGLRCRGANCYRSDRCATTSVTTFHTAPIWKHSVRFAR